MNSRRFRVAFSFAGEQREFVAKVAALLAKRFSELEILYDQYHEAEFARRDLGIYLPELYHKDSDLIVLVICPDYEGKEWCGLEWTAIHALLKNRRDGEVMLANFGHALVKGIYDTAGFINLDHHTPVSTATLILERLALNEGKAKDYYTTAPAPSPAAPATTIPNNLPRLQPFFGREAELAQIREALHPANRSWGALIDGPGGMGKTSLAVRAAQLADPAQFDRIIFASIKDRELDDDGLRYLDAKLLPGFLEMLGEVARELGLTDFGKSAEEHRPRLLLDALRPLKVLLVLDNLETLTKDERDQLFNFVKRLPGSCKAILTSRRRIGSGADALILEKLSQDAALQTLAELAKRNKLLAKTSEAERIVLHTQTGGNPLLLRWTAGQLGQGSCRTFTDAIAYLRRCPPGNDPLEFVFGDLAREFTPEETQVLAAITYFTQPATVEHIATVAGADLSRRRGDESPTKSPDSERLLTSSPTGKQGGAQVGRAVLSPPPDATAFPNATNNPAAPGAQGTALPADAPERRFPNRLLGESEREAGLETGAPPKLIFDLAAAELALRTLSNRSLVVPDQEEMAYALVPMVADFLRQKRLEVVKETGNRLEKRAYAIIVENGFQKHDRFPVLDAAWPSVSPAIPLLVAGPNPRLQTVCDALQFFLNYTGRWDEWLALSLQAEAKALAAGDHDNAGWRAFQAGWVHHLRQQADEVLACAARAGAHWTQAQAGVREQSTAIQLRSLGHRLKQNYAAALTDARQVVELRRSLAAESADVAIGLNDVAAIEHENEDYPAAERDYREALRIARAVSYAEGVANCTGNLATLALDREDWTAAEALAREALPLSEKVGRNELVASNNHRLAMALLRQDRQQEALPHALKAVELYTQLGLPDLAAAQATLKECQA